MDQTLITPVLVTFEENTRNLLTMQVFAFLIVSAKYYGSWPGESVRLIYYGSDRPLWGRKHSGRGRTPGAAVVRTLPGAQSLS